MLAIPWSRLALIVLLCCAAAVRFYHLGTPTLWFDEMWSVLIASLTPENIIASSLSLDQHPPFHNLLVKSLTFLGSGDFALRSFFAVCGVASLYAMYRLLRQCYSQTVALTGVFFLSFHPLHVWISRTLRVYSLFFLLAVVSYWALLPRLSQEKKRRDGILFFVNIALCLAHYIAVILVFAEWILCLGEYLRRHYGRPVWRDLIRDAIFFFVPTLAALPFLLHALLLKNTGNALGTDSIWFKLVQTTEPLRRLAFMDATGILAILCTVGLGFGFWGLARKRELLPFGQAAVWIGVFLGVIIVSRYSNIVTFAYIIPSLIPLTMLAGGIGAWMEKHERVYFKGLIVCALACVPIFIHANMASLYQEDNTFTRNIFPVGNYKAIAKELPQALKKADFFVVSDLFLYGGINWYLSQFANPNPISHSYLPETSEMRTGCFVSYGKHPDLVHNIFSEASDQGVVANANSFDAICLTRKRAQENVLSNMDGRWLRPKIDEALRDVAFADHVTMVPQWGGAWIPTGYDTPARIVYNFQNGSNPGSVYFSFHLVYNNISDGSVLALALAFDEESETEIFRSSGPDPRKAVTVAFRRDRPFGRVRLVFRLKGKENRIHAGFSALDNVALKKCYMVTSDRAGQGRADTRLLVATGKVALDLPALSGVPAWRGDNVLVVTEEDGHKMAVPRDPSRPASLILPYESSFLKHVAYYPRVGNSGSSVLLLVEEADGSRRQVATFAGYEDKWTPLWLTVAAPLENVPPAPGRKLVFELLGKAAQLHLRDDSILTKAQ